MCLCLKGELDAQVLFAFCVGAQMCVSLLKGRSECAGVLCAGAQMCVSLLVGGTGAQQLCVLVRVDAQVAYGSKRRLR